MRKIFFRRETFGLRSRRTAEEEKEENTLRWKGWSCQRGRRKRRKIFGNGKKYPLNVARDLQ